MKRLATGLAVLLAAGCTTVDPAPASVAVTAQEFSPSASAIDLAADIRAGRIGSEQAVAGYLARIAAFDTGEAGLHAVIALNPDALAEARILDEEARAGRFRGPLHGVPVLIKDVIETRELPTTAGSAALAANDTGRDAPIVARLRAAGAIVLGKTNLSEWANFRTQRAPAGWSTVGGQTRNPFSAEHSPCGSSSGSAVAVAAGFAPLALGTETNASLTCPAAVNGVAGFKPTVGLLPGTHIVPVSPTQDTAGPMARDVRDIALALTVMAGPGAEGETQDYLAALDADVGGLRLGVFRWAEGSHPEVSAVFDAALAVLEAQGAVLVDIEDFSPNPVMWSAGEAVLHTQLRDGLDTYLAETAPEVAVRSLAELIAFNDSQAQGEGAVGQDILIAARDARPIDHPDHVAAVVAMQHAAREEGIDAMIERHEVAVLLMPAAAPAAHRDPDHEYTHSRRFIGASWLPAMAGYPMLTVPMGTTGEGLPLGLGIVGTAWDDARVLSVGHAYQQAAGIVLMPEMPAD